MRVRNALNVLRAVHVRAALCSPMLAGARACTQSVDSGIYAMCLAACASKQNVSFDPCPICN